MIVDVRDFQTEVLDASQHTPIVVDFWAEWCGPCKALGPTLEKLASEANGTWTLAKVDVEEHQLLASQAGIRSIPTVMLIYQGRGISQFQGALPEAQIKSWLEEFLPEGVGLAAEEEPEPAPDGTDPEQLLLNEQYEAAREAYRALLASKPDDQDATLRLALLTAVPAPDEAQSLLAQLTSPAAESLEAQSVQELLRLRDEAYADGHALPLADVTPAYRAGLAAVIAEEYADALAEFIEVILRDKGFHNEAARRNAIALFHLLGRDHPISKQFRRRFDMALY